MKLLKTPLITLKYFEVTYCVTKYVILALNVFFQCMTVEFRAKKSLKVKIFMAFTTGKIREKFVFVLNRS